MYFSKVDEILESDEEIAKSVNPSRFDGRYLKPFLSSVFMFLGITGLLAVNSMMQLGIPNIILVASYIVPAVIYLRSDLKRRFVMYHFTDREIIEEEGIMNKEFNSIIYNRIQDVVLDEGVEERIFDVGDIDIRTAGTDNAETILNGLRDPEKYKREISKRSSDKDASSGIENSSSSGMEDSQQGKRSTATGSGSQESIEMDVIRDEIERIENQIQRLNQKSNSQGLNETERERWYKLEGQKELLERFRDQASGTQDSEMDNNLSMDNNF